MNNLPVEVAPLYDIAVHYPKPTYEDTVLMLVPIKYRLLFQFQGQTCRASSRCVVGCRVLRNDHVTYT
jgi:hypothetical protein